MTNGVSTHLILSPVAIATCITKIGGLLSEDMHEKGCLPDSVPRAYRGVPPKTEQGSASGQKRDQHEIEREQAGRYQR